MDHVVTEADLIRKWRLKRGLTQLEAGERCPEPMNLTSQI
jgi:hypothetical protein